MGVVVFDSDVLIGFLNADDAHHEQAVEQVRASLAPGARRLLCAVNYAEILIGPLRAGRQDRVKQMLAHFTIEIIQVDDELAEQAATVRARTRLKLPDAFALATVTRAKRSGSTDVSLASFDTKVLKAHASLNPPG
ncbi:MAG: PIN domain-containing protein [Baekduia sp.]